MAEDMQDGCNLMRMDAESHILWKASPPIKGMQDCFTEVQWDGQNLTAGTWSGYRVSIDPENGEVTVLGFTK
ncbi:hypothetical protein PV773_03170 [Mesorhizobium sp. CC13]|uniref:hypothetical protein n=1 Tax=Mesorhizobium sp. CC13 TaxID=3029194 RepID=UPI003264D64F